MMPIVSVIIPAYNRANTLPEALRSVQAQTLKDWEAIIIDDGSSDETESVARSFQAGDDRIRYIHQTNRGRSAARNVGIAQAKGEYVAFLDSDDVFLPRKLETQVLAMQAHPEYGMAYTNYTMMSESGEPIKGWGLRKEVLTGYVYPALLYSVGAALMYTSSVIVRRDLFASAGMYDETMHYCEDLDLWRRVARLSPILQIREALIVIRGHDVGKPASETMRNRLLYLQKAFRDDPSLSARTRRSLYRDMYLRYGYRGLRRGEIKFFISAAARWALAFFKEPVV
jgi:glycosyltransferase involved in cell wall biosynthesis